MKANKLGLALLFCILVATPMQLSAAEQLELTGDNWLSASMYGRRAGYFHTCSEKTVFRGRPGYRYTAELVIRFGSEAAISEVKGQDVYYCSTDLTPIFETHERQTTSYKSSDADPEKDAEHHTVVLSVSYGKKDAECRIVRDGESSTTNLPLPDLAELKTGVEDSLGIKKLSVGDKYQIAEFSLDSLDFIRSTTSVVSREQISVGSVMRQAYKTVTTEDNSTITRWLAPDGTMLRYEEPTSGISAVQVPRLSAIDLPVEVPDLAAFTGVVTANTTIPDPTHVVHLRMRVVDFPFLSSYIVSDARQKATKVADKPNAVLYDIVVPPDASDKSPQLPIKHSKHDKYITPSEGVESNDPAICKLAKEIIGDEKNACRAARLISAWIHTNIVFKRGAVPANSASAALTARSGLCRHRALLYAALARSVGIPTRIVVGLAYIGGTFGYHAWGESLVGEWTSFDPSFDSQFVDATHIKLGEGDSSSVFSGIHPKSFSKAEILECRTTSGTVIQDGLAGAWLRRDDLEVFVPTFTPLPADQGADAFAKLKAHPCLPDQLAVLCPNGSLAYISRSVPLTDEGLTVIDRGTLGNGK